MVTGDGWTEVRRRNKYESDRSGTAEMFTFYAAGFQDGTSKVDLRRLYDIFGHISDIYIGGKKNKRKQDFAFIRFMGVKDTRTLEADMQGVKLRGTTLLSNLAKYQKDMSNQRRPLRDRQAEPVTIPTVWGSDRDSRSFAQVVAGNTGTRFNNPPTPPITIPLNPKTMMGHWIHKKLLIGEAHSLDHIANLSYHMFTTDGTKYLGGLRMAIKFSSSMEAREFLKDKTRWQEWFKWMALEDHKELRYERLAWLCINGVPLRYWDGDNFSCIASTFGKVIIPFDNIHDKRDFSVGKVGVITTIKTWINEEIQISVDGAIYVVGVVEYSEDWTPFNLCHSDKDANESDSDIGVEDGVEEGISDTWLHDNDNELEEGELWYDSSPVIQPEMIRCQDECGESSVNPVVEDRKTIDSMMRTSQGVESVNEDNQYESIGIPQEANSDTLIADSGCKAIWGIWAWTLLLMLLGLVLIKCWVTMLGLILTLPL